MAVSFFACGFQLMFITAHLPQFLAICGLPPSVGASALGLIGLGNAAGSYVVGLLGARYSQKRLLALIYLLRTLAIAVYLAAIKATSMRSKSSPAHNALRRLRRWRLAEGSAPTAPRTRGRRIWRSPARRRPGTSAWTSSISGLS
jgi:predicted MFS family arabinose efflux permease